MAVELIYEFEGMVNTGAPDIPFSPKWDPIKINEIDPDPMYVRLPLGSVGTFSKNGRQYERRAVERLVEMINTKLPPGNRGHMKPEDRSTRFDLPTLRWVGAVLDNQGTAWGKAYVPSYVPDVRQYLLTAESLELPVATSLYAWADMQGKKVMDLDLESIDLADPARAGVHQAIAVPTLSTEMEGNPMTEPIKVELTTPVIATSAIGTEIVTPVLTVDKTTALVTEQAGELDKSKQLITELQGQVAAVAPVLTMVERCNKLISESSDSFVQMSMNISASGNDLYDVIQQMIEKLTAMQSKVSNQTVTITEMTIKDMVKQESLRPVVRALIGEQVDSDTVRNRISEILAQPHIEVIAKSLVIEQSGGNFVQAADGPKMQEQKRRESVIEHAKEIAAKYGLV